MSIFKSTLEPYVAAQLKAREKIIGQIGDDNKTAGVGIRDEKFLRFTSGKNAWVRLQSFVNYDSQKLDKKKGWVSDGNYKGDQLAKKYILEGGTLTENGNLREGVIGRGAIYASELDKISANPNNNVVDRLFGYRPMPGITSANVINISAYGSLREATIQFYAWDRHQLEELEVLFMRPGYTCLFEWGWSQYLSHDEFGSNGINTYPNNISIENFVNKTGIDIFSPGFDPDEDKIYALIEEKNKQYRGNYDAMLGFVKNFTWQLMPNGGFECSTTLISRGEALETLKASSNPNIIVGSTDQTVNTLNAAANLSQPSSPVLSYFEKIFLNLIGYINESEISQANGQLNPTSGQKNPDGSPIVITQEQVDNLKTQTQTVGADVVSKVKTTFLKRAKKGKIENIQGLDLINEGLVIKAIDGGVNGSAIEYMSFDSFIAILNTFFVLKVEETKKPLVHIVLPNDTPFLISEDTVSVDPTCCLLNNPNASFVTEETNGFNPELYVEFRTNASGGITFTTGGIPSITSDSGKKNIGSLGKLYISMQKVIDIYRSRTSSDGVSIIDVLNTLLEDINLSLGGLNNFKLYTTKNLIQIIDAHYLEDKKDENGAKDQKFTFDLIGLKSVCRDVKINSRIFSEQSSMIGIGAAASGTNNIGDIYSSTQTAFNRGLTDRVVSRVRYGIDSYKATKAKTKINGIEVEYNTDEAYYFDIVTNILSLRNHLKYKVLGSNDLRPLLKVTRVPQESEIINASSLLKTVHYQLNGKDVDFKALIPFELEIVLDGISGFITGQIFRIDKSILPKEYNNKNFGFIITKISHSFQNNDWTTTVTTQVCLLDNDDFPYTGVDKEALKKKLQEILNESRQASYLQLMLTDVVMKLIKIILTNNRDIYKKRAQNDIEKANFKETNIYIDKFDPEAVYTTLNDYTLSDFKADCEKWISNFQAATPKEWSQPPAKPAPLLSAPKSNDLAANLFNSAINAVISGASAVVNGISSLVGPGVASPNFKVDSFFTEDGRIPNFPKTTSDFGITIGGQKIDFDYALFHRILWNGSELNEDLERQRKQREDEEKFRKEREKSGIKVDNTQIVDLNAQFKANQVNERYKYIFSFFSQNGIRAYTQKEYDDAKKSLEKANPDKTYTEDEIFKQIKQTSPRLDIPSLIPSNVSITDWLSQFATKNSPAFQNDSYIDPYSLHAAVQNWVVQVIKLTNPRYDIVPLIRFSRWWDSSSPGTWKSDVHSSYIDEWVFAYDKFKEKPTNIADDYSVGRALNQGFNPISDINLKENIELIGKSNKGINIYKFKYKNQEGYYQGVIAQELLNTEFENALVYTNNHYSVNYSKIDVEFKKLETNE